MTQQPASPRRPAPWRRAGLFALPAAPLLVTVLTGLTPSSLAGTHGTAPWPATRAGVMRPVAVPASIVRVGSCRASGSYATCTASGSVSHPVTIHLHVSARRGQRVGGSWTTTCYGYGHSRLNIGSYGGWASRRHPLRRRLSMSTPHPSSCSVSAYGQLSHRGKIHVWITARH